MAKRTRTARSLAVRMARVCAENRCRDVAVLDLRKLSPVTDFFVVATGTSARQMRAVSRRVVEAGKELGDKPFGVEGVDSSAGADDARCREQRLGHHPPPFGDHVLGLASMNGAYGDHRRVKRVDAPGCDAMQGKDHVPG